MTFRVLTLLTLATVGLTGCVTVVQPPTAQPTPGATPAAVATQLAGRSMITGTLKGPDGVIGFGAGNVIAAGAGQVIAPGGGQVIAPGGGQFAVLALAEAPLANAEVFLADAAGNPIPSIPPVKTDAQGNFTLANVPADRTFVVAARVKTKEGKPAAFKTLVKTSDLGTTANIDAASTMVTTAVTQQDGSLGKFNAVKFKTAVDATARNLDPAELPDFADTAAIVERMNQLAAEIQEIKSALDEIKAELQEIKQELADIKAMLARQKQPAQGTGTAPEPSGDAPPTAEECAFAFGYLDGDYNGALDADEFVAAFPYGAEGLSAEQLFVAVDANGDGYVALEEFVGACSQPASGSASGSASGGEGNLDEEAEAGSDDGELPVDDSLDALTGELPTVSL